MAYCILKSYKLKSQAPDIFSALSKRRNCFFLDSSLGSNGCGRFSFLGADPFFVLRLNNIDPFSKLRREFDQYELQSPAGAPPFIGGAVGYFSYDMGFSLEDKLKALRRSDLNTPDCIFGFYNKVIAVDHYKNLLYICASGFPEKNARLARLLAQKNFQEMSALLAKIETKLDLAAPEQDLEVSSGLKSNFSKQEYIRAVKRAKEYIKRGDIYQVNLSQRFEARSSAGAAQIYRRLRKLNPTDFGAYFDAGKFQILSSSPERFLMLRNGSVLTRPMKGTRPRAVDSRCDQRLRRQLLDSAKDKAELMMIVDLERNDLGRVCAYDSVKAPKLRELEVYNTVYQTTATVQAKLHDSKDRFDLLRSCFPGGSITGCPKIRAMQVIDELEPHRRSVYTGSLGYLSFCGNMDFNILIRTILKSGKRLYFNSGGGIVADSRPESEYQETIVKARGMLEALGICLK